MFLICLLLLHCGVFGCIWFTQAFKSSKDGPQSRKKECVVAAVGSKATVISLCFYNPRVHITWWLYIFWRIRSVSTHPSCDLVISNAGVDNFFDHYCGCPQKTGSICETLQDVAFKICRTFEWLRCCRVFCGPHDLQRSGIRKPEIHGFCDSKGGWHGTVETGDSRSLHAFVICCVEMPWKAGVCYWDWKRSRKVKGYCVAHIATKEWKKRENLLDALVSRKIFEHEDKMWWGSMCLYMSRFVETQSGKLVLYPLAVATGNQRTLEALNEPLEPEQATAPVEMISILRFDFGLYEFLLE